MRDTNPNSLDDAGEVPTIEEERRFLAQCEYINRGMTATGVLVRRLLRERGWRAEWCDEDEEEVWSKTFPDGTTQHLDEMDAYFFEEEYARQFFRDVGIATKPRGRKPPPECPPS
jgi:hypothetical protein